MEIARSISAGALIGCRMTKGGFGGCTVDLVESTQVEAVRRPSRGYARGGDRAGGVRFAAGAGCVRDSPGLIKKSPWRLASTLFMVELRF